MKKYIATFFGVCFCAAQALCTPPQIELVMTDGSSEFRTLDESVRLTFRPGFICIAGAGAAESIALDKIAAYRFIPGTDSAPAAASDRAGATRLAVETDVIVCLTPNAGSAVTVTDINGIAVRTFGVAANREHRFRIGDLAPGIYIVTLDNESVKISL